MAALVAVGPGAPRALARPAVLTAGPAARRGGRAARQRDPWGGRRCAQLLPSSLACGRAQGLRGAGVFRGGDGVWVFFPDLSVVRAEVEPGVKTAFNGCMKPGQKGLG